MKKPLAVIIYLLAILCNGQTEKNAKEVENFSRSWVGDIEQDDEIDDKEFAVCNGENKILQYFELNKGPVYRGEKPLIISKFYIEYKPILEGNNNGWVGIRFIVNCKGKAGRFRISQSDFNYQDVEMNEKIVSQLLKITKSVEKWSAFKRNDEPIDYYMYLIFKIKDGEITEILP